MIIKFLYSRHLLFQIFSWLLKGKCNLEWGKLSSHTPDHGWGEMLLHHIDSSWVPTSNGYEWNRNSGQLWWPSRAFFIRYNCTYLEVWSFPTRYAPNPILVKSNSNSRIGFDRIWLESDLDLTGFDWSWNWIWLELDLALVRVRFRFSWT
jgi:hypothetical protein